jgi:hypothetical protein
LYLYLCVEFAQIIWITVVYFEGLLTFSWVIYQLIK